MAKVLRVAPPLPVRQQRMSELERLFGEQVEVISLFSADPAEIIRTARGLAVQAIVADSMAGDQNELVSHTPQMPVLRPMWERYRTHRGEIQQRFVGYGLLTEWGEIEPLADAALRAEN